MLSIAIIAPGKSLFAAGLWIEIVEQDEKTLPESVKFPSDQDREHAECQSNDNKSGADIDWEGDEKNIELGEHTSKNTKNQPREEEDGQHWSAELYAQGKHM